jgi:hypothetical protein
MMIGGVTGIVDNIPTNSTMPKQKPMQADTIFLIFIKSSQNNNLFKHETPAKSIAGMKKGRISPPF